MGDNEFIAILLFSIIFLLTRTLHVWLVSSTHQVQHAPNTTHEGISPEFYYWKINMKLKFFE